MPHLSFVVAGFLAFSLLSSVPVSAAAEDSGESSEDKALPETIFDTASPTARYLVDTGPLRVRDQFPLSIGFLGLDPVGATVLETGDWQVDIISTLTNTWAQSDVIEDALEERTTRQPLGVQELQSLDAEDPGLGLQFLDAEMHRTAIAVRHGLGRGVQLEVLVPIIRISGGFLDSAIEGFHDSFGFGQAGRQGVDRDAFLAYVSGSSGSLAIEQSPGTDLGDIVLGAKFLLREPNERRRYHLAIETLVELPTGDDQALTSNGELDLGAQILLTRYFRAACFHFSTGLVWLGEWKELGLDTQTLSSLMLTWEQSLGRRTAGLIQATVSQTPFDELNLPSLDETSIQLTLGIKRVIFEDKVFFLGLTENLQNFNNTADIGIHVGLTWGF